MRTPTLKGSIKFLFFLILLIFPIVNAQEESTPIGSSTFNANNPELFDYVNGDYATIDWSKVDWTKIPENRINEVPSDKLEFSKLNAQQKNSVTTAQLEYGSNLQKAGDLTKYKNAISAINDKYGVEVTSLGTGVGAKARIDDEGFLVADFGEGGYAPLEKLSKGTKVKIDNDGNVVIEGESKPPLDGFYVATYPTDKDFNVQLGKRKDVPVRGELIVEGKNLFVEKGALVDGILIPKQNNKVSLFLDGEQHEGAANYVSIGADKIFAGSDKDTKVPTKFGLVEENPFFDFKPDDKLSFAVQGGSAMEVQKREDLVPLVRFVPSGGESASKNSGGIFNGKNNFLINKFGEIGSTPGNGQGSVPFTLIIEDGDGNNLLGTEEEPIKVIFDDSHNFAMVAENFPPENIECLSCTLDISKSQALQNYVKGEILQLEGLQGKSKLLTENPAVLSRVLQGLKQLTPEARESIDGGISVVPDDQIQSACGITSGEIHACRIRKTGEIILKEGVTPLTIIHEVGHSLDSQLGESNALESEKDLKTFQLKMARKYNINPDDLASSGKLTKEEVNQYVNLLSAGLEEGEQKGQQEEYQKGLKEIIKDVPFRPDRRRDVNEALLSNWNDGTTGPKKKFAPCPSAYACSNEREFVAEWTMNIATKGPEFWKPLLTPPGQPGHDPAQYDESYWKTYQFFAQHGFVTEENKKKMESLHPALLLPSSSPPEELFQ